jgi:hypothetical protein
MNTGTKDPNRGIGSVPTIGRSLMPCVRDYGGQKWLGWLDDM